MFAAAPVRASVPAPILVSPNPLPPIAPLRVRVSLISALIVLLPASVIAPEMEQPVEQILVTNAPVPPTPVPLSVMASGILSKFELINKVAPAETTVLFPAPVASPRLFDSSANRVPLLI